MREERGGHREKGQTDKPTDGQTFRKEREKKIKEKGRGGRKERVRMD